MIDNETALAVLEASEQRRAERRRFLAVAGGSVATFGALTALSACNDDRHGDHHADPDGGHRF